MEKYGRVQRRREMVYGFFGRGVARGRLTVREKLVSARLGIAGMPEDFGEVLGLCSRLNVAPVILLGPGDAPPAHPTRAVFVPSWEVDALGSAIQGEALSGLWAASSQLSSVVGEACAKLGLPTLPCPDDERQGAIPIEGALLYSFEALSHLPDQDLRRLPVPSWVRTTCTGGDSSCMRLDHPNDLSLASAKLHKRNTDGPIRIQPVVEGPVYRVLAFKTGAGLAFAGLISEEFTSSVYRVPLGMSMPVGGAEGLLAGMMDIAEQVNALLPSGWGYLELEFADSARGLRLLDVQCPARLDPQVCRLVGLSQGIDLRLASLACALGMPPELKAVKDVGVAMTWLLARSGVVTGVQGVEAARQMPGVVDVCIVAAPGDILSHVVDIPSRERGGYVIAKGETVLEARERLEAARAMVWINTSPALV